MLRSMSLAQPELMFGRNGFVGRSSLRFLDRGLQAGPRKNQSHDGKLCRPFALSRRLLNQIPDAAHIAVLHGVIGEPVAIDNLSRKRLDQRIVFHGGCYPDNGRWSARRVGKNSTTDITYVKVNCHNSVALRRRDARSRSDHGTIRSYTLRVSDIDVDQRALALLKFAREI